MPLLLSLLATFAAADYGCAQDTANKVSFTPVGTSTLRLEVKLQPGMSGGVLEWEVE